MTDHLSREQMIEGADPTPVSEYSQPTIEQLWMVLLDAPWDKRKRILGAMRQAQEDAQRCMLVHHQFDDLMKRAQNASATLVYIDQKLAEIGLMKPSDSSTQMVWEAFYEHLQFLRKMIIDGTE